MKILSRIWTECWSKLHSLRSIKAEWVSALGACVSAVMAVVMVLTLFQTRETIKAANRQLEIEQEPKLECAYDITTNQFILQNAGTARAENIFLHTDVCCLSSNSVLIALPQTNGEWTLGSTPITLINKVEELEPSERDVVNKFFLPDMRYLSEVFSNFNGQVLVRLYVEYERPSPAYRRYSGTFNFAFTPMAPPFGPFLLAEDSNPLVRRIVEKVESVPVEQWNYAYCVSNKWSVMQHLPYLIDYKMMEISLTRNTNGKTNVTSYLRGVWTSHH